MMNNVKITSLICGGILTLAGTNLLAQQSSTDPNRATSTQPGVSTPTTSAYGASSTALSSGQNVRLSQLMNSSVQSQEGKTLGHVRDLLVDPQSGRIEFAVLSLSTAGAAADTSTSGRETVPSSRSSVAGTPSSAAGYTATGKLIPVPWQLFNQSWSGSRAGAPSTTTTIPGATTAMGQQTLVLNIDESKLRTAPSFDASNWNELQSGTFEQRVYSYFGVDRSTGIGTPGATIRGQGASGSSLDYPRSTTSPQTTPPRSDSSTTPQSGAGTQPQPNPDR
jgi:sporulation protein YlmC with PRC-barrel domain